MFKFRSFCLAVCLFTGLSAQQPTRIYPEDPQRSPGERQVDFTHLFLDVSFKPEERLVSGKVKHSFQVIRPRVDSLFLHGPGVRVKDATLKGNSVTWKNTEDGLIFYFSAPLVYNSNHELEISYQANPARGLYFIGWDDTTGRSRSQIWSQGQGIDNRHWIPMYDILNDKVISEIKVTFPSDYYVLSNGKLLSRANGKDGNTVWHYRMPEPHSTYLIMLGLGKYKVKQLTSTHGVPINLLYYPDHEDRVDYAYKYSAEMMDWFENEIGVKYAWGTYSQIPVQDFMFGAMENTSATLFGDFFMVDARGYNDRNYVGVNAHELAHQWFGDLITARSLMHHWLQESFATYYNMMYERVAFGDDYFDWSRRQAALRAFAATESDLLPVAHSQGGTSRHYPKGAMVLHMLRQLVGEEGYRASIKNYLERNKFRNVDSYDLMNAFEETLGTPLNWFWDQWVFKGGEPHLSIKAEEIQVDGTRFLEFSVAQIQHMHDLTSVFILPMRLAAYDRDNRELGMDIIMDKPQQTFRLQLPQSFQLGYYLADPGCIQLKKTDFPKPFNVLSMQARYAKNLLDRWDAIQAMENISWEQRLPLFTEISNTASEYYPVKEEIARQAFKRYYSDESAKNLFLKLLSDDNRQVRKAVAMIVQRADKAMADAVLVNFSDTEASYDLLSKSLQMLAEANHPELKAKLDETAGLKGNRGLSYRVTWLEVSAWRNINKGKAINELEDLCSPSFDFLTRVAAFQALSRLNVLTATMLMHAQHALQSPNGRLAGPVREALRSLLRITENREFAFNWMSNFQSDSPHIRNLLLNP
jgi:aminopeptidase N